jgi:hypothetical protein
MRLFMVLVASFLVLAAVALGAWLIFSLNSHGFNSSPAITGSLAPSHQ